MTSNRKLSKTMSYLLRHNPEGMKVTEEGWVQINQLLQRLRKRNLEVDGGRLREIVETDPKGRYELDEDRLRARYGHSLDHVDPTLTPADKDVLYHGTSPENVDQIRSEGLQSEGRQKVHLSATEEEAETVGRRHHSDPVILEVDAEAAMRDGIRIERASSVVYVADRVPPEYICDPIPPDG